MFNMFVEALANIVYDSWLSVNKPVGLNNIGNTCYLNSVLQYYYTLIPFRQTILDHVPYQVDRYRTSPKEQRRAIEFIQLLRELFSELEFTAKQSISPQYELACIALLCEKYNDQKEETSEEETTFSDHSNMDGSSKSNNTNTDIKNSDIDTPATSCSGVSKQLPQNDDQYDCKKKSKSKSKSKSKRKKKAKEKPRLATLMFGRPQDVTECMMNIMYLVEMALKSLIDPPVDEDELNTMRCQFYGKTHQYLTYFDANRLKHINKQLEEDFSHIIIDASKNKSLYEALDEYFFPEPVKNMHGRNVYRSITIKSLPSIFQVHVQRVQFDKNTAKMYKSNANIMFDKNIYLDRYMDVNFNELKAKREAIKRYKQRIEDHKNEIDQYSNSLIPGVTISALLMAAKLQLENLQLTSMHSKKVKHDITLDTLKEQAKKVEKIIETNKKDIENLKDKIVHQFDDYTEINYKLHAVFMHRGDANFGHYWIYILDHKENQWWQYNDSHVNKVNEAEILGNSSSTPYFLVYIDAKKVDDLVHTITSRSIIAPYN